MKSTFEIITETTELFYRFSTEMPYNYMQEVFGKDDEVLAKRCLQAPKNGVYSFLLLIYSLKPDERKAMTRYINRRDKIKKH